MEINRRRDYLNSLSRTDLQRLAKKCPGIKANWKSQTIRERLLDPIFHIEIPASLAPASAGQNNGDSSSTAKLGHLTRSSTKRKQAEVCDDSRTPTKRCRSASVQTDPVNVANQLGLTVSPRHGGSRDASAGPMSQVTRLDAQTTASGLPTRLHSAHGSDLCPIAHDWVDTAPKDYHTNIYQQGETTTPSGQSIMDVTDLEGHGKKIPQNSNGKRPLPDSDDQDIQPRSRPRLHLEDEDTAPIPRAHKGKAKMTAAEYDAWIWDARAEWIVELIKRGRKDQAEARARKLQEQKRRQKQMEFAHKALITMMEELGSDFLIVLSSSLAPWARARARTQTKNAAVVTTRLDRQRRESGPSSRPMGYSRDELNTISRAASAITELLRQGYTLQQIQQVLSSPM